MMSRNPNREFGTEDDNIDFDAIRKKHEHVSVEELDEKFEDFKKELFEKWKKTSDK